MPRLSALRAPLAPISFTDRTTWERYASDPLHAGWREAVLESAAELPRNPPLVRASDQLACRRDNDRTVSDHLTHDLPHGVAMLAMRRCLQGPGRDDQLLDWFWHLLYLPTWVGISHLPGQDLPRDGEITIDLMACMIGVMLAECGEGLAPWFETQSPQIMPNLIHQLDARIVTPFANGYDHSWADPKRVHNNWTGVCAGSILAICVSMERLGHPRPQAKARAWELLACFLHKGFTTGGECDEGPGYWSYGLCYAMMGWSRTSANERAAHLDLARLAQVADYPRWIHLFDDTFYASNDGLPHMRPQLATVAWLAAETDNAFLHAWVAARSQIANAGKLLTLPWRVPQTLEALAAEATPPWPTTDSGRAWLVDQETATFRHTLRDQPWVVTASCGHNAEAHNHNDIGHVNLWVHGDGLLIDLGAPTYTADFFGPRRYSYLSAGSQGHNVPLIAGATQRAGRDAAGKVVTAATDHSVTFELAQAYPPEAACRQWRRQVELDQGGLRVSDEAELSPGSLAEVRWWTASEPTLKHNQAHFAGVTLQVDGGTLSLQRERAGDHALRFCAPDDSIWCIRAEGRADAQGRLRLTTVVAPA